jgi:hypothetical protein
MSQCRALELVHSFAAETDSALLPGVTPKGNNWDKSHEPTCRTPCKHPLHRSNLFSEKEIGSKTLEKIKLQSVINKIALLLSDKLARS